MSLSQISAFRFFNQHIGGNDFQSPNKLVSWLGAVQAQDYNMAKWALGVRLPGSTHGQVEQMINDGKIIRAHVLRPTWHFVVPEDLRWMLKLSAANISRQMSSYNKQVGLDEKVFKKTNSIIDKLLKDGGHIEKKDILEVIEKKGIATNQLRGLHMMLRAEIDMIVCNGPRKNKQFTYALFDSKIPPGDFNKEEALTKLAKKYFQSHGPATIQDFTWWSGLSVADARVGLENIKNEMQELKAKEQIFWFYPTQFQKTFKTVFLPAFDEFLIAYKTREVSLDTQFSSSTFTKNGIFNPIIVRNAKVIGVWKPQFKKELSFQQQFFTPPTAAQKKACQTAAKSYSKFMR